MTTFNNSDAASEEHACSFLGRCASDTKLLDDNSNDNVQNKIIPASDNENDDDDINDDSIE